jgi:hypothetical protein
VRNRERDDDTVTALEKALKPAKDPEPFVHKVVKWVKPFSVADIHIESNVPLPEIIHPGAKGSRYNALFLRMQEGDSCLLPIEIRKPVQSAAQIWRKKGHEKWHFATRVESETQFRFWRTKDSSDDETDSTDSGSAGSE